MLLSMYNKILKPFNSGGINRVELKLQCSQLILKKVDIAGRFHTMFHVPHLPTYVSKIFFSYNLD